MMRSLISSAVAPLRSLRLIAMHLVLNVALIAAATYWLLIPEAHVWQLLLSALSALLILSAFLWLHSGTLVYAVNRDFHAAFSIKLTRWLSLLLGLIIMVWLMHRIDIIASSRWQIGGYLYSKAPGWLRPVHGSTGYVRAIGWLLSVVYWYFLPGIVLPVTAARVVGAELKTAQRAIFSWRYWVALAVTVFLGVWTVSAVLQWTPGTTLHEQTMGLVMRLTVAYVLSTVAWLLTAGLLGHFVSAEKPSN